MSPNGDEHAGQAQQDGGAYACIPPCYTLAATPPATEEGAAPTSHGPVNHVVADTDMPLGTEPPANSPPPAINVQTSPPPPPLSERTQQRPTTISIPKTRSNISQSSSATSLRNVEQLARLSVDNNISEGYDDLIRCVRM